jgi:dTDP-4-dehydrorhamnose 3,5-epimerase
MIFERLEIEDLILITPQAYEDYRGIFFESFNQQKFNSAHDQSIIDQLDSVNFVQDNIATSIKKNTIRGMHFQISKPQAKFVTCIKGSILDVVVDIRPDSKTFRDWISIVLDDQRYQQLFVPKGFAHGYKSISNDAIVMYKADEYYFKEDYQGIAWDDDELKIDWEISPSKDEIIVSEQDKSWAGISSFENRL